MRERARLAQQCLVTTCAHLATATMDAPDMHMWIFALRDVLPDCAGCSLDMAPVKVAAEALVAAETPAARSQCMARLAYEVQRYFVIKAAQRYAEFQLDVARDEAPAP